MNMEETVRQADLTKLEQKIAEYLLKNDEDILFMTVAELAKRLEVSDTSIIRTTRALGFSGFADFQRIVQQHLLEKMRISRSLSPKERILTKGSSGDGKKNSTIQGLEIVTSNLHEALKNTGTEKLKKTVDILVRSRQKFIYGYRGSACLTYFLAQKLRQFLPTVLTLMSGDSEMIEYLADITSEDCLFVCSFPRYNNMVVKAVDMAQHAGAKVIALTDKVTSPIAKNADVTLTAPVDFSGFCNSYVAPLFICDLLLLLLSDKINMESNSKADLIEEYVQKLNINYL